MKFLIEMNVEPDDPDDSARISKYIGSILSNCTATEALSEAMQATVTLKIADLLDYLPKSPSDVTIDRLKRFAEQLESGEPIPCTLVSQEQTPDGPITIVKDGTLGPDGIKPNDPDRADGV